MISTDSSTTLDTGNGAPKTHERIRSLIADGRFPEANSWLKIPKRFCEKGLDNLVGRESESAQLMAAISRPTDGAYIHGPAGTGKTHLAVAAMLRWYADRFNPAELNVEKRVRGRFVSVPEFLQTLKSAIARGDSDVEQIKSLLKLRRRHGEWTTTEELDILILDDLLMCRLTEYVADMTSLLINEIYLARKPFVIFTSNFSIAEVAKLLDDRAASRLAEICGDAIIKVEGKDHRVR